MYIDLIRVLSKTRVTRLAKFDRIRNSFEKKFLKIAFSRLSFRSCPSFFNYIWRLLFHFVFIIIVKMPRSSFVAFIVFVLLLDFTTGVPISNTSNFTILSSAKRSVAHEISDTSSSVFEHWIYGKSNFKGI